MTRLESDPPRGHDRRCDLLLSHGYCLAEDEHEREIMMPYPPLGLLYLSSHLKACGVSVEVYDTTFGSVDGFAARLALCRPLVVGLSCNLMTKGTILTMISLAKQAGAWVVIGGPEPAPNAEDYLRHGTDVVVVGEGEATMEELLRHLPVRGMDGLDDVAFGTPVEELSKIGEGAARSAGRTTSFHFLDDIEDFTFRDG